MEVNELPDFPTEGPGKNVLYHDVIHPFMKWCKEKLDILSNHLALTGNQNVGGTKTFQTSPILPAPTNLKNPITKGYADSNMGSVGTTFDNDLNKLVNKSQKINSTDISGVGDFSQDRTLGLNLINIDKLNAVSKQYQVSIMQTIKNRAVGYGLITEGHIITEPGAITKVVYRIGTSDASGTTTFELRKNGTTITGSSASISTTTAKTATATFNAPVAKDDSITVYVSAVGTTPGLRLTANILIVPT